MIPSWAQCLHLHCKSVVVSSKKNPLKKPAAKFREFRTGLQILTHTFIRSIHKSDMKTIRIWLMKRCSSEFPQKLRFMLRLRSWWTTAIFLKHLNSGYIFWVFAKTAPPLQAIVYEAYAEHGPCWRHIYGPRRDAASAPEIGGPYRILAPKSYRLVEVFVIYIYISIIYYIYI